MIRDRIERIEDLPPAFQAAMGVLLLLLIAGLVTALLLLPDATRLRSPAARERARRRKESRKRQKNLRERREALQRRARRRDDEA